MTVLNGHFTMHTGDEVQWYFDFEDIVCSQVRSIRILTLEKTWEQSEKKETITWTSDFLALVVGLASRQE